MILAAALSLCLVSAPDATESTLMSLRGAIAVFKIRNDRWPRTLAELVQARLIENVPKDAWGRELVWVRPTDDRTHGCLMSRGADGIPGTADDLAEGCDRALLNEHLLLEAGLTRTPTMDAYGRPIQLLREEHGLMAWSYGPDGKPDTADDQMARIGKRSAERAEMALPERDPRVGRR